MRLAFWRVRDGRVLFHLTAMALAGATAQRAAATDAGVSFRVIPASLPEPAQIFVAGDHPSLGAWRADGVALEHQPDGSWFKTIPFVTGTELEYKVTRGAWPLEALDAERRVPPNAKLVVTGDTHVVIHVPRWKDEEFKPEGQITGRVVYHRGMEAEGLLPRDVLVWLPPSYDTDADRHYPVLYMHDAQQVFDPVTSTFGKDWQVDEWATRLIEEGKMIDILVVAVANTADRSAEYGEKAKGPLYRRFLAQTLKPFVDGNYRTRPEREYTAVMGSSMGGIASFLMVYEYPELFSKAGCLSSAFWLNFPELIAADWPRLPVRLYLDNGGVGLEQGLQSGNDYMLEVLQAKGFRLGRDLVWFHDAAAEHNEEAWAKRVWMPLQFFFGRGTQEWINALPPPPVPVFAARDAEPKRSAHLDGLVAVGLSAQFDRAYRNPRAYGELWSRFMQRTGDVSRVAMPVRYVGWSGARDELGRHNYFAGVLVDGADGAPEGLEVRRIPARDYLVFTHLGPSATRIAELYQYILDWYLPHKGLTPDEPLIEIYDERFSHDAETSEFDIYVPVTGRDAPPAAAP